MLTQELLALERGTGGVQNAGHQAVHGLKAGDPQGLTHQGGVGEGGAGAGEGHLLEGRQALQPPDREGPGEAAAPQFFHRQVQHRRRGVIGETAHHVHHFPGAVGNHLRQQKRNAAVPEGGCKLVQQLGHEDSSFFAVRTSIIEEPAPPCNGNRRHKQDLFAKMHKK